MLDLIKLLPTLFGIAPDVKKWIDLGLPIIEELKKAKPNLVPVFSEIGGTLFPAVKDQIKIVAAAADALFNPNGNMWLQESLNKIQNAGLEVDGEYGALTKAAVTKFQTAHQPASGPIDGWAGPRTSASIRDELAKIA